MGLRDLLKKKSDVSDHEGRSNSDAPDITFVRSDTYADEVIHPPSMSDSRTQEPENSSRLSVSGILRGQPNRSSSVSSNRSDTSKERESATRRLSHRLHLHRSPSSSENVPQDLPEIVVPDGGEGDKDGTESQWERRATMLARENEKHRSRPPSPSRSSSNLSQDFGRMGLNTVRDGASDESERRPSPSRSTSGVVSSKAIDEDIQEAIRLHEEGHLQESTAMFGRLADPKGSNNPLSQVLYGLALR